MSKNTEGSEVHIEMICAQFRFLLGKVLTVIDATITNEKQNKSVKDIIKNDFNQQCAYLTQALDPDSDVKNMDEVLSKGIEVVLEE